MGDEERRRKMCTGKTRYKDEAAATTAIHAIAPWGQADSGAALRVYRCDFCGRWHLTSRPNDRR